MFKRKERSSLSDSTGSGIKEKLANFLRSWFSNLTTEDGKFSEVGKTKINITLTVISTLVLIIILLISGSFKIWKVPIGLIFVLLGLRGDKPLRSKVSTLVLEVIVLLFVPSFLAGPLKSIPINFMFINGTFLSILVKDSLRNLLLIYLIFNLFKKSPGKKVYIWTFAITAGYAIGLGLMGEESVQAVLQFLLQGWNDLIRLLTSFVDAIKNLF